MYILPKGKLAKKYVHLASDHTWFFKSLCTLLEKGRGMPLRCHTHQNFMNTFFMFMINFPESFFYSWSILGEFLEHFWRILWGFFEDSWRILGGFLGDSWGILGGFSENFWRICRGFSEDSWKILGGFFELTTNETTKLPTWLLCQSRPVSVSNLMKGLQTFYTKVIYVRIVYYYPKELFYTANYQQHGQRQKS